MMPSYENCSKVANALGAPNYPSLSTQATTIPPQISEAVVMNYWSMCSTVL